MKWILEHETRATRVYAKMLDGLRVERIDKYGLHSKSIHGKSAIGTYARFRWATVRYRCQGQTFCTWGDLLEFVGDKQAQI